MQSSVDMKNETLLKYAIPKTAHTEYNDKCDWIDFIMSKDIFLSNFARAYSVVVSKSNNFFQKSKLYLCFPLL